MFYVDFFQVFRDLEFVPRLATMDNFAEIFNSTFCNDRRFSILFFSVEIVNLHIKLQQKFYKLFRTLEFEVFFLDSKFK